MSNSAELQTLGHRVPDARLRENCEHAKAQTEKDCEETAAAVAEKKPLTADEEAELTRLWKKLAKLYNPDRFADQPDKLETYGFCSSTRTAFTHSIANGGEFLTNFFTPSSRKNQVLPRKTRHLLLIRSIPRIPRGLRFLCFSQDQSSRGRSPSRGQGTRLAIAMGPEHSPNAVKAKTSQPAKRVELGKHIVADPEICGGQPTFKGTRVMVWIVLEQLEDGLTWAEIVREWDGKVKEDAIAEAISIADLVVKHEPFRGFNVGARRKHARRATAVAA